LQKHYIYYKTKQVNILFSLFIPAVFFHCFRKFCRFQSIHSQCNRDPQKHWYDTYW